MFSTHHINLPGSGAAVMSIEFDQAAMANMTTALEQVCNRLPPDQDTHKNRKRIADAMIAHAQSGRCALSDFQSLGSQTLREMMEPGAVGSFDLR